MMPMPDIMPVSGKSAKYNAGARYSAGCISLARTPVPKYKHRFDCILTLKRPLYQGTERYGIVEGPLLPYSEVFFSLC